MVLPLHVGELLGATHNASFRTVASIETRPALQEALHAARVFLFNE
jgi:hypothetical protein